MGSIPANNNKALPATQTEDRHLNEKAYYEGYRDFVRGRLECPYNNDSLLAKEWQRGQNSAYFVNLKLLNNGTLLWAWFKKKQNQRLANKKIAKAA